MSDKANYFGPEVAVDHDEGSADMFTPEKVDPTVDLLVSRAGTGRARELGVGTGRVALPLARRGVPVHGIDLSEAMVAELRGKPGNEEIETTIGDFASTRVEGSFSVAYLVFNTIMNLTSQDEQVDCFCNVAAHLEPDGRFVIEVGVPDLRRLPEGQTAVPFHVSDTQLGFDLYDTATQYMSSHHVRIVDGQSRHGSIPFRYVWPAELDLMARIAGMHLVHRWEDWEGTPFTERSGQHVSVWEKPADCPRRPACFRHAWRD